MIVADLSGVRGVTEEIVAEYVEARRKHGPFNSGHEGYAVILEELDELWDEVRRRTPRDSALRKESTQVAAMALAFIMEVCEPVDDG
jgi:hypothetical protein